MSAKGDSFIFAKQGQATRHLWVVLTAPNPDDDNRVIIVNVTTLYPSTADTTTVLAPGEHPFIVRQSAIYYMDARSVPAHQINGNLHAGYSVAHQPVSAALLAKLHAGLLASEFTPPDIKDEFIAAQAAGLA